jgi:hypothetical protein
LKRRIGWDKIVFTHGMLIDPVERRPEELVVDELRIVGPEGFPRVVSPAHR